jgi:signal transduction histidine kinase/ActR/RegA family two-component response regulator
MAGRAPLWRSWSLIPLVAVGSAITLLLAGVVAGLYGEKLYRDQKVREAGVEAGILAATASAAVVFEDAAAAQEYVNALQANPEIEAVGLYNENGLLVAGYHRGGAPPPARVAGPAPPVFEGAHLVVTEPMLENGTTVGAVRIRSMLEPVARRFSRYGAAALLIGMAALLLGVLGAAQAALARVNRELRHRARDLTAANRELQVQIEEREKAEEALRQSQKMEAIGQLTGGVAHDFNNLLMVASSGLDLMDRTKDADRRQMLKDSIRQAIDRGSALTRQLLAFSRRTTLHPEVIDLAVQVEGLRVLLDRSLREDIQVELSFTSGLWPVEIDPHQFELALLNMAVNARDAMPDGGAIVVAGENAPDVSERGLSGDFVRLCVSDTGQGMPPELIDRVFEPFFTTKEPGRGTGLGLSQVYGFTRASGGDVRIESVEGEGTTITLLLPRSDKPLATKDSEADRQEPPRGEGRVLLVEDDDGVAALVGEMLRELGYEPVRAANAAEALKLIDKRRRFDIVFSDMVMPGAMDGIDLAREIAVRRPGLPVVLTTGFSEAAQAARHQGLRLLTKPYRLEQLAKELKAAKEGARTPA